MMKKQRIIFKRKPSALVLGSGGAKGVAHISIIEQLVKLGLPLDIVVGSSIGSVIAAAFGCGTLDSLKKELLLFEKKKLSAFFDPVFPRYGLIRGDAVMKFIERFVPRDTLIEDMPFRLAVTATDFANARTVVFTRGDLHRAIRASISVPGIFVPVKYRDSYLIDGGIANPLPVNIARHMGAGTIVAVNLNATAGRGRFRSYYLPMDDETLMVHDDHEIEYIHHNEHPRGDLSALGKWKTDAARRPSVFSTLAHTVDIMSFMTTRLMLRYSRPTVLIEPDVEDIKIFDFNRASDALTRGFLAYEKESRKIKFRCMPWIFKR